MSKLFWPERESQTSDRKRLGSVLSKSRKSLRHDRKLAPVIPPVPCAAIVASPCSSTLTVGQYRSKLCSRPRTAGFIHVDSTVACATFSTAPVSSASTPSSLARLSGRHRFHLRRLHRRLRDFQYGTTITNYKEEGHQFNIGSRAAWRSSDTGGPRER